MPIRRTLKSTLEATIGPERTLTVARTEKRLRRSLAARLDPSPTRPTARRSPAPKAPSRPKTPGELASAPAGGYVELGPLASHVPAPMTRHEVLALLHEHLAPRTYLETGVSTGASLALSRTRSIGIDPAFTVTSPLHCDVHLVREGSDDFFARPDALDHFDGVPIDLAFVDGMHLAEFALRDLMNIERAMAPTGVLLMDDVLPRNPLEAARDRQTGSWTGDVFKVVEILREQRPDLTVILLNTRPTGTALIVGFDPTSDVLLRNYAENLTRCLEPDPQDVPADVLHRTTAIDPRALVDAGLWTRLRTVRDAGGGRDQASDVFADLPRTPMTE